MNKEEAVKIVGYKAVALVESTNVDFSAPHGGEWTHFSASVASVDPEGEDVILTMTLKVLTKDVQAADGLDEINWDGAIADAEYSIS